MAQPKMRVLDKEAGYFGLDSKFHFPRDYTTEYVESHAKVFVGAGPKEVVKSPAVKHEEVVKQSDNIKPYSALTDR